MKPPTWLAIVIVAIVAWYVLQDRVTTSPPAPPSATSTSDPYDQTGCSASKRAVAAKLRSPGSANWISCRVTTAAGVQSVTLALDSQNGSGGLVRSEWLTKVRDNNVESVTQLR